MLGEHKNCPDAVYDHYDCSCPCHLAGRATDDKERKQRRKERKREEDIERSKMVESMTITQLVCQILMHCGNSLNQAKSCMCCSYAREIGRRGGL